MINATRRCPLMTYPLQSHHNDWDNAEHRRAPVSAATPPCYAEPLHEGGSRTWGTRKKLKQGSVRTAEPPWSDRSAAAAESRRRHPLSHDPKAGARSPANS
ncbi:hypothetical protein HYPGJ_10377 [Hyphomicrobium sp. GJ21]|nr:hypothetical protein HYPGJ_10377 [Hyphomicrobium sp. GJ21]